MGGGAIAGGTAGGSTDAGSCQPVACPSLFACGAFDAGCGVERFCGRCRDGEECGRLVANRCDVPRVCTAEGWCWEHPLPQGGNIISAFARSEREVWFGTESGAVLFSNGEFTRGTSIPTQPGAAIRAIHSRGPGTFWVVGEGGRVISFVDGGSWLRETPTTQTLQTVTTSQTGEPWIGGGGQGQGVVFKRDPNGWVSVSVTGADVIRKLVPVGPDLLAMDVDGRIFGGAAAGTSLTRIVDSVPTAFFRGAALARDGGVLLGLASVALDGGTSATALFAAELTVATPGWQFLVIYPSLPPSAIDARGDRFWIAGEAGNVVVFDFLADGGLSDPALPAPPDPLYRTVVSVSATEARLAGQSGVMGGLVLDGGTWEYWDNRTNPGATDNRYQTLNDGCAAMTPTGPLVYVTAAGNSVGERLPSGRWQWPGGPGVTTTYDWNDCLIVSNRSVWVVGTQRPVSNFLSRVLWRDPMAGPWTDIDIGSAQMGMQSNDWASVAGSREGHVAFLSRRTQDMVLSLDGGIQPQSWLRYVLDAGVTDLVALPTASPAAVHGSGVGPTGGGLHLIFNLGANLGQVASQQTLNIAGSDGFLALSGVADAGDGSSVIVYAGRNGTVSRRRNNAIEGVWRVGATDFTDVWLSQTDQAWLITAIDAGVPGRLGGWVASIERPFPDGGLPRRFEPLPIAGRPNGVFGLDGPDGGVQVWVTGSSGALLKKDLP